MLDTLMDLPWWLPTTLIAVGGYLAYDGNRRQDGKLRTVGLLVIMVATALMGVSYAFDTPREKVTAGTRRTVDAIEKRDWATFTSLLDPQVGLAFYQGRDALVAGAKASTDAVGLRWANIVTLNVEPRGPRSFTVRMTCLSDQDRTGRPVSTDWELTWADTPQSGWVITEITPLGGSGAGPEAIEREMVR